MPAAALATWSVTACAVAGIVVRPWRWHEAVWAVGAALVLVAAGLVPWDAALQAVGKGTDVYLFLVGMMLLSETARHQGLFDWVAAVAARQARGSGRRLFVSTYAVGVLVTTFLSNDATAVVLTPAVCAAARRARVDPLPYLLICAFVANAASFVLPISNPANIVLYGRHTPSLAAWVSSFALPAAASILATYAALRFSVRRALTDFDAPIEVTPLSRGAKAALAGLLVTGAALSLVSALDRPLGPPTAALGLATAVVVALLPRHTGRQGGGRALAAIAGGVSWGVVPLVAGLFVLVEGLARTGVAAQLAHALSALQRCGPECASWSAGTALALGSNVFNNLPAGLLAGSVVAQVEPPKAVVDALLIGVDLGPNLSITGSLATLLWLSAVRREGLDMGYWRYARIGACVTTPALLASFAAYTLLQRVTT